MSVLNLLGIVFSQLLVGTAESHLLKKAHEMIKITVVSVLHSFQLGYRCICPFPYFSGKISKCNKRYNSIETVSLLVTAHLNLSKAFASICPSILLNKLGTMNMCECPELVPKLS